MKILVPVDGSKYSKAAVNFLASRTTLIGEGPEVLLFNVQTPVPVRAARAAGKDLVQSYYEDEATSALRPAMTALKRAGIEARTSWVVGSPAEKIASAADKFKADLIVMGSHGHGALTQLVLGSTSNAVLAHTMTPLLLLRADTAPAGDALTVGIAVDGSKYGKAAAAYVAEHRNLFGTNARFELIHVVPDFYNAVLPDMAGMAIPALSDEEIATMQNNAFENAVAPTRKLLEKAGLRAEEVRLVGNAGDQLSAYSRKRKLDLLVAGSHGYHAFKSAVLGSVATRVAANCETPLLLIREA
jgi:nucleotide-binding universal stress UspA family protein